MLPLLLGLALAQETPADLEARLLGPASDVPVATVPVTATGSAPVVAPVATPAVAVAPAPATPSLEMPPWWTFPLLALGLGWAWTQRKRTEKVEADAMRVLGRTPLGKDASVVLLEVRDAHGAWRRLLVGSGGDGPQLITGLGAGGTAQAPQPVASTLPAPAPVARRAQKAFTAFMDREEAHLDLPEVPAYPVAEPAPPAAPPSMVASWTRDDAADPVPAARPVLGPAGALAAAIHGRVPRGAGVSTEPPPVRAEPTVEPSAPAPPAEARRSAQDGMDLLAEVRRAKSRVGTRVQAYG